MYLMVAGCKSGYFMQTFTKCIVLAWTLPWSVYLDSYMHDKIFQVFLSVLHIVSDQKPDCESKTSQSRNCILRPILIQNFNEYMDGVDKQDYVLSYHNTLYKIVRYWKTLFYHLRDVYTMWGEKTNDFRHTFKQNPEWW